MKKIVIVICAAILIMACNSAPATGKTVPAAEPVTSAEEQTSSDDLLVVKPLPVIEMHIPSFKTKESVYSAAGALDEYVVFVWDGAKLMSETRYSASDTPLEKSEYRYDRNGTQPIMKTTKIIEDGKEPVKPQTQVLYVYNAQKLLTETLKTGDGNDISSFEYTYDGAGNRISRSMKNTKGIEMARTVYTYTDGKLVSSETTSVTGDRINSIAYKYDAQGNCTRQETRNRDGIVTSVLSATWQDGFETRVELTGPDNTPQLRETNEYNSNGDMIKKIIENLRGKSVQIVQYEYKLAGQ